MFYPSDYEIKRTKEREICERVERAQADRLIQSIRPHRAGWLSQSTRGATNLLGRVLRGVGKRLEKMGASDIALSQE